MKLQIQLRKQEDNTDMTEVLDPRVVWNDEDHPWHDLTEIVLTHRVPKKTSERAKFDLTFTGDLNIETLADFGNMGELTNIREKMLSGNLRVKRPETPLPEPEMTTFLVHAETGHYLFSGTDAGVYISLFGNLQLIIIF